MNMNKLICLYLVGISVIKAWTGSCSGSICHGPCTNTDPDTGTCIDWATSSCKMCTF